MSRMSHTLAWALQAQAKLTGQEFVAVGDVITAARKLVAARVALADAHETLCDVDRDWMHGPVDRCTCPTAQAYRDSKVGGDVSAAPGEVTP